MDGPPIDYHTSKWTWLLIPISFAVYILVVYLIYGKEYSLPWREVSWKMLLSIIISVNLIWLLLLFTWRWKVRTIQFIVTALIATLSLIAITDLWLINQNQSMW